MATIANCVTSKVLEPFALPDWERRLAIRSLWIAGDFWDWVDAEATLDTDMLGGRTLYEHMQQTFCDFRCAPTFPAGDLKQLMPTRFGVRKMHPPKLRIYGWCCATHQFVAVAGALESATKSDKTLNDAKRDEVLNFIKKFKLEDTVLLGDNLAVFPPRS